MEWKTVFLTESAKDDSIANSRELAATIEKRCDGLTKEGYEIFTIHMYERWFTGVTIVAFRKSTCPDYEEASDGESDMVSYKCPRINEKYPDCETCICTRED